MIPNKSWTSINLLRHGLVGSPVPVISGYIIIVTGSCPQQRWGLNAMVIPVKATSTATPLIVWGLLLPIVGAPPSTVNWAPLPVFTYPPAINRVPWCFTFLMSKRHGYTFIEDSVTCRKAFGHDLGMTSGMQRLQWQMPFTNTLGMT